MLFVLQYFSSEQEQLKDFPLLGRNLFGSSLRLMNLGTQLIVESVDKFSAIYKCTAHTTKQENKSP